MTAPGATTTVALVWLPRLGLLGRFGFSSHAHLPEKLSHSSVDGV
jgi:hypothetical protein